MNETESKQVRTSRVFCDRLKKVAERDGFTLGQAYDMVIEDALPDLENGSKRLQRGITTQTKEGGE